MHRGPLYARVSMRCGGTVGAARRTAPSPSLRYLTSTTHQSIGVSCAPRSSHHDGVLTGTVIGGDIGSLGMVSVLLAMDDEGSVSV